MSLGEYSGDFTQADGMPARAALEIVRDSADAERRAAAAGDIAAIGLAAQAIYDEDGMVREGVVLLEDYLVYHDGSTLPVSAYAAASEGTYRDAREATRVRYLREDAEMMRFIVQQSGRTAQRLHLYTIGAQIIAGSKQRAYMQAARLNEKLKRDPRWSELWKEEGTRRKVHWLEGLPADLPDQSAAEFPPARAYTPRTTRQQTVKHKAAPTTRRWTDSAGRLSSMERGDTSADQPEVAALSSFPLPNERVYKKPPKSHPLVDPRAKNFTSLTIDFAYRIDGSGALRTDREVLPFSSDDITIMAIVRGYDNGRFFEYGQFFGDVYRKYCQETGTKPDPRDFWNRIDRIKDAFASRGISDWRDGAARDHRDGKLKRRLGLFSDQELQARKEADAS